MALRRLTHGVQFVRVCSGIQNTGAAAFGHPIELDQSTRPAPKNIGFEGRSEGGTGAELDMKRGQVALIKISAIHDALVLHRHQHGVCDAVLFAKHQILRGIELGHDHHAAAQGKRWKENHQSGVGIERGG